MSNLFWTISILALLAPALADRTNIKAMDISLADAEVHDHMASQHETNDHASKTSCAEQPLPDDDAARIGLGGIANMDALVGNDAVMTYAWGPAFEGKGQIFAWGYDQKNKKIQFWYAKHDHILRDKSNKIGTGMKQACYWKLGDKCPDLAHQFPKKTFGPGGTDQTVNFAGYGQFEINQVQGRWRFTKPGFPECFLDHVYACTDADAKAVYSGTGC